MQDVVKPAVKEAVGYDLVDMRDVAQAGVIDDIMCIRIRDSALLIADLTHDNRGAYWEAGYARGLEKLVIFICEKEKSEEEKSHSTQIIVRQFPGQRRRRRLLRTADRYLAPLSQSLTMQTLCCCQECSVNLSVYPPP